MHKALRTLSLSLLISVPVLAQPVLNNAYAPTGPTSWTFQDEQGLTGVPSLGANQSWNFTLSRTTDPEIEFQGQPVAGGPAPLYTRANYQYSISQGGASGIGFYLHNAVGIQEVGGEAMGFINYFREGGLELPYGLSFGQSMVDTSYEVDSSSFGTDYYMNIDTLTYAGYGTLSLNGATYTDVVLISRRLGVFHSDNPAGPYQFDYIENYRSLYVQGMGFPILQYYQDPDPSLGSESVSYATNVVTGTRSLAKPVLFTLAPTPANGTVRLNLPGDAVNGELAVLDATGRRIANLPYSAGRTDVSALAAGIYTVETVVAGKTYRGRLVKE